MDQASLPEALFRRKDRTSFQVRLRWCSHRRDVDVLDIELLMIEESKSGVNIKTRAPAS
jgi:hypothetical protein